MKIKIYLRAIKSGKKYRLAMIDSDRNGAINNLTTEANPGDTLKWVLDCNSGIKSITRIVFEKISLNKKDINKYLKSEPDFSLKLPEYKIKESKKTKKLTKVKYLIKCILEDHNKKLIIDPFIRIPPPE
jgi:hypothetical protein